jgi:hypothetical protein
MTRGELDHYLGFWLFPGMIISIIIFIVLFIYYTVIWYCWFASNKSMKIDRLLYLGFDLLELVKDDEIIPAIGMQFLFILLFSLISIFIYPIYVIIPITAIPIILLLKKKEN